MRTRLEREIRDDFEAVVPGAKAAYGCIVFPQLIRFGSARLADGLMNWKAGTPANSSQRAVQRFPRLRT